MHSAMPAIAFGYQAYLVCWISICVLIGVCMMSDRSLKGEAGPYLRLLLLPWKILVFLPAGLFVTFAGSFAYDDTWDIVSGGGMSVLTFLTAPWAIGAAWQAYEETRPKRHAIYAAVLMLFSASWFYDGWLLLRDGQYTDMWLPNLLVSPFLYVAAGFLWNVEIGGDRKPSFAFMRADWPMPPQSRQRMARMLWLSIPFAIGAAAVLIGSVQWRF